MKRNAVLPLQSVSERTCEARKGKTSRARRPSGGLAPARPLDSGLLARSGSAPGDEKIVRLGAGLHRLLQPARPRATSGPCLAIGPTILRCHLAAFERRLARGRPSAGRSPIA